MNNNLHFNNYKVYLRSVKFLKKETINNYSSEVSVFLKYLGANELNFDFYAVDHLAYLKFRYGNNEYQRSYTNKIIQYLHSFYNYLKEEGFIKDIPGWLFEKARAEKRIPNVLSLYELYLIEKQFSNSKKDARDAAIIHTLISTGLRISELLNLKLDAYKANSLNVPTKGGLERLIIINDQARNKIDPYIKNRGVLSPFLFCNNKGFKITTGYINKMIKKACIAAGIKKRISAHSFRHTYATLLFEGGANIIEVRDLMGHTTVQSTEIYTKVAPEHLRKELARCHPAW